MAVEPHTPTTPKRPPALKPGQLRSAILERGAFFCVVPSETTFDEVMTPAFWQHHWQTLNGGPTPRPFAIVEVVREDGTMDLELRVMQAKAGMVKMRCLRKFIDDGNLAAGEGKGKKLNADGEDLSMPDGYGYAHVPNGNNKGHMVRIPGGEVLVQGLPSKAAAAAAARKHFLEASTPTTQSGGASV